MKILVSGSSGFIGSNLINRLKENNYEIMTLDIVDGFDITKWDSIKDITGFDIIIHLAAIIYIPLSYEIPREMYKINIIGTLNMLELARINNAKLVFASSYVYGKTEYLPADENHPTEAFNPYCRSKLIGEELCRSYNKSFDVPIIIMRVFNIYGKGQNSSFLIPSIIKQINETGIVNLMNSRPRRDFVFIDDVVDAYIKAVHYDKSSFEIFNIGSGESYSVKEIVELIAKNYHRKITVNFSGIQRKNEVLETKACIDKAKSLLNWNPKTSFEKGLRSLLNEQ